MTAAVSEVLLVEYSCGESILDKLAEKLELYTSTRMILLMACADLSSTCTLRSWRPTLTLIDVNLFQIANLYAHVDITATR
jgi:hypothetical protein